MKGNYWKRKKETKKGKKKKRNKNKRNKQKKKKKRNPQKEIFIRLSKVACSQGNA